MYSARRTEGFTESVIREMTRLSQEYGAINLAQGFPDFPAPPELKDAAARAILDDHNQYSITWGSLRLREAIAAKVKWANGIDADPGHEITVTCGASEAMMSALLSMVNPGDEVVVFEPYYENYLPGVTMASGKAVFVPLEEPDFRFDPQRLRRAFSHRTKAIIVNTPNNPTGRVFSHEELRAIAELCQEFDAVAITDEIYEHITFDGHRHISLASLPGMRERTITVNALSKSYSVTGWRVGYAIAAPGLTNALRKVHDYLTVCAPSPLQEAAITALNLPPGYYAYLRSSYAHRRQILLDALREAGFLCHEPQGAYYIMTDFGGISDLDDVEFAHQLVKEVGVAAVPGTSFYQHKKRGRKKLRFSFPKRDETLQEVRRRLLGIGALSALQ
ncbi:MAG: aminotransferase class I/II-fold pyridoxal phosphate-dependent enzyme [Chloroflexi bacterium]|nr:aminotransferase class I/II-fold pyridoxal phosphate-dependent enzyme [Chloroflexota bacterium]